MTDEPIFWAQLLAKGGHATVGCLIEQSLIGESYIRNFRKACAAQGIRIVAEEWIAQTAQDVTGAVQKLHEAKPDALVHCGFGFGVVGVNPVLDAIGWDPPRFMGTAFQNAWINELIWNAMLGWTGVDQYDPANPVGQQFLESSRRRMAGAPSTACRSSTETSRPSSRMHSPMRIRSRRGE